MVNSVTSSYKPELFQPIVWKIINNIPEVVSIVNNINTSVGNTSIGEAEYILHGNSTITECLRGLLFEISASSFFQTNTYQIGSQNYDSIPTKCYSYIGSQNYDNIPTKRL